jgi:hypothetical protein
MESTMIARRSTADNHSPVRHRRSTRTLVAAMLVAIGWAFQPAGAAAQGPPALPPVAVGPPVTIEGEVDALYEDDDNEGRLHHFLNTANGRVKLHIQGDAPDLHTGSHVRVSGNLADGEVTTTSVTTIKASPTRTLGAQRVLVILFNFSNNPTQPYSKATVESVNNQVRSFYQENSYGQTFMEFTVAGWFTIAATNTTCDYYTFATQAEAKAANAGFNLTAYDRRVFAFPQASSCKWWGMGNLSGPRSWVNGSYGLRVVAHEQGHNFGNNHSHSMPCSSTGCTTVEYGSDRDVLGKSGVVGHLNAFQKERLGWLNYGGSPVAQTVTTSDDYWIDNYELIGGNTKALKIWNPNTSSFYYIESRAKVGFDGSVAGGVTLHRGQPTTGSTNYQVDMAPTTTTWDSTLDPMQIFKDDALGLTVQTLSSNVDGAMVRIVLGGSAPACTKAAPAVSMALSSAMKYTVTVTNRNSSSCAAATFNATAAVPSGWSAAFSSASLPIASGASASTALTLTAPTGTVGTFTVGANAVAAGGGAMGSATTSVTLAATPPPATSSLAVTTSATLATQTRAANTATIRTRVMAGDVAVPGAAVTVVVTTPQGRSFTWTATTAADGNATVNYAIKKNHPGTYQVAVTASANGKTGSATTTFTIP